MASALGASAFYAVNDYSDTCGLFFHQGLIKVRTCFGTGGVRGRVGEFPMTPDFAMKFGWATGQVLGAQGRENA